MKPGDRIERYGREWVVLDPQVKTEQGTGILILATEIWTKQRFDEQGINLYSKSTIKKFLEAVTEELEEEGGKFEDVELSMIAEDGTGWEEPPCKVHGAFLLTVDMYRKYRRWIPTLDGLWWLATAYSFHSDKYYGNSYDTRIVLAGGELNYDYAFRGRRGVVPALVLSFHECKK